MLLASDTIKEFFTVENLRKIGAPEVLVKILDDRSGTTATVVTPH